MSDNVNSPFHYRSDSGIEVIDAIEAWNLGFCKGNIVKYVARAGLKNPAKEIEDLEKAKWYLEREIKRLRAKDTKWPAIEKINQTLGGEERIWENGEEIK